MSVQQKAGVSLGLSPLSNTKKHHSPQIYKHDHSQYSSILLPGPLDLGVHSKFHPNALITNASGVEFLGSEGQYRKPKVKRQELGKSLSLY